MLGIDTSSDAPEEVCRITFEDTPKEAKLHEGSAFSNASSRVSFLHFSSDAIPLAIQAQR